MSLLVLLGGVGSTTSANTYTYQWQDSSDGSTGWANIGGATSSSYVVVSGEAAKYLRCRVTATNSGGSATASSSVLAPVASNSVAPAVTGTATVGSILTTTDGTWSGTPSFTYQWQRDGFGNGTYGDIASATSSTYPLVDADDGCHVRCNVSATNASGTVTASSNATATVVELAPTLITAPVITGTVAVAQVVTCSTGTFAHMGGHNPSYAYQWQVSANGSTGWSNIAAATASTHTVAPIELAQYIRCSVTATNSAGSLAATTVASAQVADSPGPPGNQVLPVISGATGIRDTLTVTTGTWTRSPTGYAYQWQSSLSAFTGFVDIVGATSSTYVIAETLQNYYIQCVVTATNSLGSASVTSLVVGAVTGGLSITIHTVGSLSLDPNTTYTLTLTPL